MHINVKLEGKMTIEKRNDDISERNEKNKHEGKYLFKNRLNII